MDITTLARQTGVQLSRESDYPGTGMGRPWVRMPGHGVLCHVPPVGGARSGARPTSGGHPGEEHHEDERHPVWATCVSRRRDDQPHRPCCRPP